MTTRKTLAAIPLILLPLGVLAAWLQAAEDPPTELYVRTTPAGATLFLDGKPLGASPDVFEVTPGEHELLAVLEGHKSVQRDIVVPATRIKRVILTLASVGPAEDMTQTTTPAKTQAELSTERRLARLGRDINCKGTPLDELLELLGREVGVNIVLDLQSLSSKRINPDAPIELELMDVSLAAILEAALRPLGLEYTIEDEVVVVRAIETIFLPDAATPELNVALDLASGQMLPVGDGRELARLGKGDLLYDAEGGSMVCLRGGRAVVWGSGRFIQYMPRYGLADGNAYPFHTMPCRMLIRTAEGKAFDVTILSRDTSKEGDEGIPGNIPGVRLKYERADPEIVSGLHLGIMPNSQPPSWLSFLPDREEMEEMSGGGHVLDLASGEVFKIDAVDGFADVRQFTRTYHKGDLSFGYILNGVGQCLGLMRGATAAISDDGPLRPLEPNQKREDVTVCQLPPTPCHLLVTTAEDKVYDVWLLKVRASRASDAAIPRNVSGISLRHSRQRSYDRVRFEASADQSTSETKIADEILRRCAEAVWTELPGKLRGTEPREVEKIAAQFTSGLVTEHILPHADEVVAHLLAELPKAEPIDLSQWTVKLWIRSPQGELMDSQPRASAWNAMAGDWNPMAVFWIVRKEVMTEELGSGSFGKRCLLQSRVPVGSVLLGSRIDRPVIAQPFGDELFVAHLERPDGVYYRCREVQWLQRKPGEAWWSFPLAPSGASEGQKLVAAYTDAFWARMAPRLDDLSWDQINEETRRLTEEYFQGHQDELSREADRVLAQAPQAEPLDPTRWVSRLSESDREKVNVLLEEVKKKSLAQPFSLRRFWDPMFQAQTISMSCIMRLEGNEALAARITLAAASFHPMHSVWRIDPNHVAVVQGTGDRITVVYLQRTSEGWYLPTDFDVLVGAEAIVEQAEPVEEIRRP